MNVQLHLTGDEAHGANFSPIEQKLVDSSTAPSQTGSAIELLPVGPPPEATKTAALTEVSGAGKGRVQVIPGRPNLFAEVERWIKDEQGSLAVVGGYKALTPRPWLIQCSMRYRRVHCGRLKRCRACAKGHHARQVSRGEGGHARDGEVWLVEIMQYAAAMKELETLLLACRNARRHQVSRDDGMSVMLIPMGEPLGAPRQADFCDPLTLDLVPSRVTDHTASHILLLSHHHQDHRDPHRAHHPPVCTSCIEGDPACARRAPILRLLVKPVHLPRRATFALR